MNVHKCIYIHVYICTHACLCIRIYACVSCTCLPCLHVRIALATHLFIYPSSNVPILLSIYFVYLSIYLSNYLSVYLSICLSFFSSICPCIYTHAYSPVYTQTVAELAPSRYQAFTKVWRRWLKINRPCLPLPEATKSTFLLAI